MLAARGFGSRRVCEELIADGRVTVNGDVAVLGRRVDPEVDLVEVDGAPVGTKAGLVHYLLNKPRGVVTTARDTHGRPTVVELVPAEPRVFPVGRLDADTEGLLLMTNDGELANRIAHPRHGIDKEYLATVAGGSVAAGAVRRLRDGVELDDGVTAPARVSQPSPGVLRITIHEGRNRQVRRMCEAIGHPVTRLVRTRIGPIQDRRLRPGSWRALTRRRAALASPRRRPEGRRTPPVRFAPVERRANVIGLGLIGGSIALALRENGWHVSGDDIDAGRVEAARTLGCIDGVGLDASADVTFVAVPVLAVADQVKRALAETTGVVTDVGGVKSAIAAAVNDPRFVGGHPMAGSELDGLDGADAAMFNGAVWVLTPVAGTDDVTFAHVAGVVAELGAEVVAMAPDRHDEMVAVVSHVPHLTAASLMGVAADRAEEHAALLRLAAGGFRDMTRVASGHPDIWLDICAENRPAILSALDALLARLDEMREIVRSDARDDLQRLLQQARDARTNLPIHATHPEELAEVRIPIPDRTGAAAEIFTLAAELGVNIASFEVVHLAESNVGVAVVLVAADVADLYRGGLLARGFRPAVTRLS